MTIYCISMWQWQANWPGTVSSCCQSSDWCSHKEIKVWMGGLSQSAGCGPLAIEVKEQLLFVYSALSLQTVLFVSTGVMAIAQRWTAVKWAVLMLKIILKSQAAIDRLTSAPFKSAALLPDLTSLPAQKWTAMPLDPLWYFWWFCSLSWHVALKIQRQCHAQSNRRFLKVLVMNLWLCVGRFLMPRDGVSKVADTLPLFWLMKHNNSSRSIWRPTRTGGLVWHLLLQTWRLLRQRVRLQTDTGDGTDYTFIKMCIFTFYHVPSCDCYVRPRPDFNWLIGIRKVKPTSKILHNAWTTTAVLLILT